MLSFGTDPFISLKDYTMNLTPKGEFLNLLGKFHLESNFSIPDEFLEVVYSFTGQKVDRLFLRKAQNDTCNPSSPHLRCSIYENLAIIDSKNDSFFSKRIKDFISTNFQVNLKINSFFHSKRNDFKNISWWKSLNNQLSDIKLINSFNWKNVFTNEKNQSQKLEILENITFKNNSQPIYSYHPFKIYISNSKNENFSLPIIYLKDVSSRMKIKNISWQNVSGKIIFFVNSTKDSYSFKIEQEDFQLENFADNYWRYKFTSKFFEKILKKIKNFDSGKLELDLIVKEENRKNSVSLVFNFFNDNDKKSSSNKDTKIFSTVTFDPEGFKLDNLSLNKQWMQEEL